MGAQRQDGTPRADRRRRQGGGIADPLGRAAGLQRHPHLRHLRRPRRQALAADRGRLPQARQCRRTGRIRPHRPYRHADRVAAADGRAPRAVAAEEALGAAGGHPPVGPLQPAAVPSPLLLLHRLGADARHLRQADQRLGFGRQASLRRRVQPDRHRRVLAGDAGDRDRHQAGQQGTDPVSPEAPRLQQRDHRGLQVPLDVSSNSPIRPPRRR